MGGGLGGGIGGGMGSRGLGGEKVRVAKKGAVFFAEGCMSV